MADRKLRITRIKSAIGRQEVQKRTLEALGLRKLNQVVLHPDNPQTRGMIFRVAHLLRVEEVEE
jgi:large subunit ribosomal protein L30